MRDLALARRVLLGGLCESPLVLVNVRNVRLGNTHGEVVGRIFKANITPRDRPWFWAISVRAQERTALRGYAATREHAMAALTKAVETRSRLFMSIWSKSRVPKASSFPTPKSNREWRSMCGCTGKGSLATLPVR